ncbi:hypothetical protein BpHYR1_041299 [Brachionus plicatilis]|uniref:Uncharacterized protein n=1 Tax=Brachionus plicatilis TaxID=10195 RepID=A0A3M7R528_BRAPC|nr:hypothetical protein BpHYR1_041299 [Brachionus plicatilis]
MTLKNKIRCIVLIVTNSSQNLRTRIIPKIYFIDNKIIYDHISFNKKSKICFLLNQNPNRIYRVLQILITIPSKTYSDKMSLLTIFTFKKNSLIEKTPYNLSQYESIRTEKVKKKLEERK